MKDAPALKDSHGWMAEFGSAEHLRRVTEAACAAGYDAEAYAPVYIEGLPDTKGVEFSPIGIVALLAAALGGIGGVAFDSLAVGLELAILCGASAAGIALVWAIGLPMLRRLRRLFFNVNEFGSVSRNRFFLVLRADDPAFDEERAAHWLDARHPLQRVHVPA